MITIDQTNKIITVTNENATEFIAGEMTIPMTDGSGFVANLPDDLFTCPFTVCAVCEKQEWVPTVVEEPIIEEPEV